MVLAIRLNMSGTCADLVSVTHGTGLPASVKRSVQVRMCGGNWWVQYSQPQSICVLLVHQGLFKQKEIVNPL